MTNHQESTVALLPAFYQRLLLAQWLIPFLMHELKSASTTRANI
jgi:hypothetical protein